MFVSLLRVWYGKISQTLVYRSSTSRDLIRGQQESEILSHPIRLCADMNETVSYRFHGGGLNKKAYLIYTHELLPYIYVYVYMLTYA